MKTTIEFKVMQNFALIMKSVFCHYKLNFGYFSDFKEILNLICSPYSVVTSGKGTVLSLNMSFLSSILFQFVKFSVLFWENIRSLTSSCGVFVNCGPMQLH